MLRKVVPRVEYQLRQEAPHLCAHALGAWHTHELMILHSNLKARTAHLRVACDVLIIHACTHTRMHVYAH